MSIQLNSLDTSKIFELSTKLTVSSPYYLSCDKLPHFAEKLGEYHFDKVFLITDSNLDKYFAGKVGNILGDLACEKVVLSAGESYKNFNTLTILCEELIQKKVTKDSILIAMGGGVIGNIVGLTAALLYRGIRFIEMPTTTMAQTDSTLSNKQAVNGVAGKNLFGVYYAPIFIWSDIKFLMQEPIKMTKSGLVESVKNGFISDKKFLDYLDQKLTLKEKITEEELMDLVYNSILSKIKIIEQDPSEKGYGMILEYGHTFSHALEVCMRGKLLHGEGVAIGMMIAAKLGYTLGLLSKEDVALHKYYLQEKLKMNLKISDFLSPEIIMQAIKSDNKRTKEGIKYVVLEKIGKVYNPNGDYMIAVDDSIIKSVITDYLHDNNT